MWGVMGLSALALTLAARGVFAQAEEIVTVTVLGIHATTEPNEHIDPALRPIADELRRSPYNCFRLIASDTRRIPLGETSKFAMIEGYALHVHPQKVAEDNVQLTITWVREGQILQRMAITLRKGKYFLSGGWRLKEGALLGAIAVQ